MRLVVVLAVLAVIIVAVLATATATCPQGCDDCDCVESDDGTWTVNCEALDAANFQKCLTSEVSSLTIARSDINSLKKEDFSNASSLVELFISECPLKEIEDEFLVGLPTLRTLYVTKTELETLPYQLSNHEVQSNLTTLNLQHNAIKVIPQDFLVSLTVLNNLDLSFNEISSINGDRFKDNSQLILLDLSHNILATVTSELFRGLQSLQTLRLSNNKITSIASGSFDETSLEGLHLDHNQISFLDEGLFEGTSLKVLNLQANGLEEVPTEALSKIPTLSHLWLSENPISTIKKDAFSALSSLETLQLENMDYLTSLANGAFTGLPNLMQLTINVCPALEEISVAAVVPEEKSELVVLLLNNNSIAKFDEELFSELPLLKLTTIASNPITCSCEAAWMKTYMDVGEPAWAISWREGEDAVSCGSPRNLKGKAVFELPFEELTCDTPEIMGKGTYTDKKYTVFEALVHKGAPSTSWKTPNGTTISPTFPTLSSIPFETISPSLYSAYEEVLSNYSVLGTLLIEHRGDMQSIQGTYQLTATNAGGTMVLDFDLTLPTEEPPRGMTPGHIAAAVFATIVIASTLAGIIYIYWNQARKREYQRFASSSQAMSETAQSPILGNDDNDDVYEDGDEYRNEDSHASRPRSYGATSNVLDEQTQQPQIV